MDFEQADAINQAVRRLTLRHRARAAEVLAPLGLHAGQEVVLLELARRGPMIQAELSEAIGSEPPSVTLMCRKLEAAGLVDRSAAPSDGRASVVALTEAGHALVGQVKAVWRSLAEQSVAGLSADEISRLPALLAAVAANVDHRPSRRAARTRARP